MVRIRYVSPKCQQRPFTIVRELGDIAPLSEAREMHIYTKYASAPYWSRVATIFRRYLWLPHLVVCQIFGCYAIEGATFHRGHLVIR